jgi:hypothetical protein
MARDGRADATVLGYVLVRRLGTGPDDAEALADSEALRLRCDPLQAASASDLP